MTAEVPMKIHLNHSGGDGMTDGMTVEQQRKQGFKSTGQVLSQIRHYGSRAPAEIYENIRPQRETPNRAYRVYIYIYI